MRDPAADPPTPAILHVCTTCKGDLVLDETAPRPGARLHDALAAALAGEAAIRVVPVECLSNCRRACTVALSGAGRWSYVYGDLSPGSADTVAEGARRYAAQADGLVPWRERPEAFRKGVIARIPPFALPESDR
jgi:predicted metal-binding protein